MIVICDPAEHIVLKWRRKIVRTVLWCIGYHHYTQS